VGFPRMYALALPGSRTMSESHLAGRPAESEVG
jgi:hypothetical protein